MLLMPSHLPPLPSGHETDSAHPRVDSSSSSGFGGHPLAEIAEGGAPQGDRDVMMGAEGMEEGGDVLMLDPDAVEHAPGLGQTQPPKVGGFGAIGESSLAGQGLSQGLANAPSTNPFAGAKSGPFGTHHSHNIFSLSIVFSHPI